VEDQIMEMQRSRISSSWGWVGVVVGWATIAGGVACGGGASSSGGRISGVDPESAPGTPGGAAADSGCQLPAAAPGVWAPIAPPGGQETFKASDAYSPGLDDLFFVGALVDPISTATTGASILHWSHGCWTVELSLPPPAGGVIYDRPSISGSGPGDVWASIGDVLYHRDAQGWSPFANDNWRSQIRQPPFMNPVAFARVRVGGVNDVWASLPDNILHWNGYTWTVYNFDDPTYPDTSASIGYFQLDFWINGPNDVWAAGGSDQVGNTMDFAFVHHFDGTSWTHQGISVGVLWALWPAGPGSFWLIGSLLSDFNGLTTGWPLRRLQGTESPVVPIQGVDPVAGAPDLYAAWGRGANDVWAAGSDVAHYDGQQWSLVTDAPAATRNRNIFMNTIVTGDAGSVWLTAAGGLFYRMVSTSPTAGN
jgi:hypothetical protein